MTRRKVILLTTWTIIFFIIGQVGYEYFYRLTLYFVKHLSSVPLEFYGKFPYWFGDPRFSMIIASIPLIIFLLDKFLMKAKHTLSLSIATYGVSFIICFLGICCWTSLEFHSLNDFYHGEVIKKNVTAIDMNSVFLLTTIGAAFLTSLTFYVIKLIKCVVLHFTNNKNY